MVVRGSVWTRAILVVVIGYGLGGLGALDNTQVVLASGSATRMAQTGGLPEVTERVRTSLQGETWHEQPDHVLYRLSQQKWSRVLRDALGLPNWVEFSLRNRTRWEAVSHTWRRGQLGQNDVQAVLKSNLRLGATRGPFSVLFEGYDTRNNGQDQPNDFSAGVVNQADILQLFASGTFLDTFGSGLRTDAHAGRFTFEFGSTRLVGRNVFPNVVNAFDGLHVNIGHGQEWRARTFLVEPRLLDSREPDEQSARQVFWGMTGELRQNPWAIVGPYYLGLNDTVSATRRVINTFGVRVHKNPGSPVFFQKLHEDDDDVDILNGMDGFEYELEGTVQTGTRGQRDFFAYMTVAAVGYTFHAPWSPRIRVLYDYASGTRSPGGSQNQTFDPLFGLRMFDMMVTGHFGPFFRSNISSPGWRVDVRPSQSLKVWVKQRFWYLAQAKDAIVGSGTGGGLQDVTGNAGNYLGHEVELATSWNIHSNLMFQAGYEHWFKGTYFDRLPSSAGLPPGGEKDTDYFFVSVEVRL